MDRSWLNCGYWGPNLLRNLTAHLSVELVGVVDIHPHGEVVFTDAEILDANLRPGRYRLWQYINSTCRDQKRLRNRQALDVLLQRNVVSVATMAYRAKLREAILPIPSGWLQDEWIALVTSIFSRLMRILEPLIRYRQPAVTATPEGSLGSPGIFFTHDRRAKRN